MDQWNQRFNLTGLPCLLYMQTGQKAEVVSKGAEGSTLNLL